ncbi:hypothetical protein Q3G72_011596 [Acer saccharum]|nr:hypothetical protein Q3G72_011596 [Acer saccharum]
MRKLQVLSFECNKLQGSIPNEVCHLRNLGELYLGGNKLSGPIPARLGDITSLRVLYLNSNNLTSTISSSLWSLKNFNMQQTDSKKFWVNLTETVSVLGPTSLVVVETVVDDGVPAGGRKMYPTPITNNRNIKDPVEGGRESCQDHRFYKDSYNANEMQLKAFVARQPISAYINIGSIMLYDWNLQWKLQRFRVWLHEDYQRIWFS